MESRVNPGPCSVCVYTQPEATAAAQVLCSGTTSFPYAYYIRIYTPDAQQTLLGTARSRALRTANATRGWKLISIYVYVYIYTAARSLQLANGIIQSMLQTSRGGNLARDAPPLRRPFRRRELAKSNVKRVSKWVILRSVSARFTFPPRGACNFLTLFMGEF